MDQRYLPCLDGGDAPDYVLQRVNHLVFQDVGLLQRNIERVTSHIRRKLTEAGREDVERRVLRVVPTKDGKLYYFDGENYWRMMVFIAGSVTHESITGPLAYLTGQAFGEFQSMLGRYRRGGARGDDPEFPQHRVPARRFPRSGGPPDPQGRLAGVRWMVDELLARADRMCLAQRLFRAGELPKRVTHCDTKVNNILFDEQDRPLCVIDLDTTMPGFVLSDFGDFIRTAANTGAEDDPDLDKVDVDMDIFRAFAKGMSRAPHRF